MDEDTYRKCVAILLSIFVIGSLVIGFRIAENGRYVQYDIGKSSLPDGTLMHKYEDYCFDTRTGEVIERFSPPQ